MNRKVSYGIALVLVMLGAVLGVSQLQGRQSSEYSADVVAALGGEPPTGFARALEVRPFKFPEDHGAHPEYQTEWWYNTGNLATAEGRRFGIHFTIFRRAVAPTLPERSSEWATNQVYFADFAVADIESNRFIFHERFARGAAGLAGTITDSRKGFAVWIEDWAITGLDPQGQSFHLRAQQGEIALDLVVRQTKAPTLQGDQGLSIKNREPGNASYYYSLTRNQAQGTITVGGETYDVSGYTWLDHEFSTSVLGKDAVGWDWFSIQLDNQRELMLFNIRLKDGGVEPSSHGTLIEADGSSRQLHLSDYTLESTGTWKSPKTGAVYPSGWKLTINTSTGPIHLEGTPLMVDQELNTSTAYWEGATRFVGTDNGIPVSGYGYVELTGYNRASTSGGTSDR